MDQADEELRVSLKKLWPFHAKKNAVDLAVPPNTRKIFFLNFFSSFCFARHLIQNYALKNLLLAKFMLVCSSWKIGVLGKQEEPPM